MITKKTARIKELLKADRYNMKDFWAVCPFTGPELISKNRKTPIRAWRQVGMVWVTLCGETSSEAARQFRRDHATVLHAQNILIDCLEGYGDPYIKEILSSLKDQTLYWVEAHEDQNVNEATCMVILDQMMGAKLSNRLNK
jgi:hypothetical protein